MISEKNIFRLINSGFGSEGARTIGEFLKENTILISLRFCDCNVN